MILIFILLIFNVVKIKSQCTIGTQGYFSGCYYCEESLNSRLGTSQSTSQYIKIGKSSTGQASQPTTSTTLAVNGIYHHAYGSSCTNPQNTNQNPFDGALLCYINPSSGNILATATPTPNVGYVYTPSPGNQPDKKFNKFYPTQVGHWFFSFNCIGSGAAGAVQYITIELWRGDTFIRRALKELSAGYQAMSINVLLTFNTIGTTNTDAVYLLCDECESFPAAKYCTFAAARVA